jgi:outer membrane protein
MGAVTTMRHLILTSGILVVLASTAIQGAAQSPLKIGYINSQVIIAEDPSAMAAQEQFQREMVPFESELQALEAEIADLLSQYQAQQITLTANARRARQDAIVQRQEAYQERMAQIEAEAGRRQQELVAPIMERINSIIQEIRSEGLYTFIFDVAGGGLIAADESFDLTGDVMERLAVGAQ